jgi:hypothetical protein
LRRNDIEVGAKSAWFDFAESRTVSALICEKRAVHFATAHCRRKEKVAWTALELRRTSRDT